MLVTATETTSQARDRITWEMYDFAAKCAAYNHTVELRAGGATVHPDLVRFYANHLPSLVRDLCAEIMRLRAGLSTIAERCVQDPEAAQFASRVLDGTVET